MKLFSKKPDWPDVEAVVRRGIILRELVAVGMQTPSEEQMVELREKLTQEQWEGFRDQGKEFRKEHEREMREWGLWEFMTGEERETCRTTPEEVSDEILLNALWSAESSACLLWSARLIDALPPYDTQVDTELLEALTKETVSSLLERAQLRSREELSEAREISETWHWRSRTRLLEENPGEMELPDGLSLEEIVRMSAEGAAERGLFDAPLQGDFPALGKPYRDLTQEEWSVATSIAMERHKAFNWVCGMAPGNRWEETPTET